MKQKRTINNHSVTTEANIPTEGFFAHGGSENFNHGPIRCACLDLENGEIVFDVHDREDRPEMKKGSCIDAATISILSTIIWAHKHERKPIVWSKDPYAIDRARKFLQWYVEGEPPYEQFDRDWHPLILKAMKGIDFDVSDVDIRRWDKRVHGENPLAYGRYGHK